jgi:hypothetical protein
MERRGMVQTIAIRRAGRQGAITFVFAPRLYRTPKPSETRQKQLHNYGAKDMVHNRPMISVFAPPA